MGKQIMYMRLASATWIIAAAINAGAWATGSSHWALVAAFNALGAALGFYVAAISERPNVKLTSPQREDN